MMADSKNVSIIEDEMLDSVSGGVEGKNYSPLQLGQAGVSVQGAGAGKEYIYTYSDGQTVRISQGVASDIYDCFVLGGNTKLSDQQVKDLIRQS